MKERPILFSAPMVRAILEGRKSQTRRTITLGRCYIDGYWHGTGQEKFGRPIKDFWADLDWSRAWKDDGPSPAGNPGPYLHVPYPPEDTAHRVYPPWQPGDQLWVRETFYPAFRREGDSNGCVYRADDDGIHLNPGWSPNGKGGGWKPSIFMPRWASRLTLRIVGVRVERLQEISGDDCFAEGIQIPCSEPGRPLLRISGKVLPSRFTTKRPSDWDKDDWARFEYAELWEEINGRDSWDANPWVWVIEFERIEQPARAA